MKLCVMISFDFILCQFHTILVTELRKEIRPLLRELRSSFDKVILLQQVEKFCDMSLHGPKIIVFSRFSLRRHTEIFFLSLSLCRRKGQKT